MNPFDDPRPGIQASAYSEYRATLEPLPRYQTFWRRAGAALIDGIVLMPLAFLHNFMFARFDDPGLLIAWYALYTFVFPVYSVVLHGLFGQTAGKLLTRVQVLDLSEKKLSMWQAFKRDSVLIGFNVVGVGLAIPVILRGGRPDDPEALTTATLIVAFASLGWVLAEFVTMLWNDKRRALHDLIAGSVVVKKS